MIYHWKSVCNWHLSVFLSANLKIFGTLLWKMNWAKNKKKIFILNLRVYTFLKKKMPLLWKTKLTFSFEISLFLTQLYLNFIIIIIFFSLSEMFSKLSYHTIHSYLLNYICKQIKLIFDFIIVVIFDNNFFRNRKMFCNASLFSLKS